MKNNKVVALRNSTGAMSGDGSKKAILLRNLGKNDVVFGTKGNGRNEVFLQLLEENAVLYVKSSKFEKMSLIQELIRDWKGNFYFLNPKTNELGIARENISKRGSDSSEKSNPSTSSKLYTSVRRMMNYVVAKNNYQYVQPTPSSSPTFPSKTRAAQQQPTQKQDRSHSPQPVNSKKRKSSTSSEPPKKSTKNAKTISSAEKKKLAADTPPVASVTLFPPTRSDTLSPIPMPSTGSSSKRAPLLVTPEPSPRIFQQVRGHSAKVANHSSSGIDLPRSFATEPPASSENLVRPTLTVSSRKTPDLQRKVLDHSDVHRLEDTAIHTLVSLSTASWTSDQETQENFGQFY